MLMTASLDQSVLARDVNDVTIRNCMNNDLPAINQLIFQLISTLDKKENTDPEFISRKSRSLFRSASSHFLVAEAGKTIVGFVHFTTRGR